MLTPVRTVAPAATPVSLVEAKAHLRVDFDDDDTLITSLIDAAIVHVDGWTGVLGRALVNQDWRVAFRDFTSQCFRLPFPDASAATVTYFDPDNAEQTVAAEKFAILHDARGSFIRFSDSFAAPAVYDDRLDAVRIEFTAGYGVDADDVPQPLKQAILLLIGHWFEHREAVAMGVSPADVPMAVDALIAPYRRIHI